jgi:hypothetical protein
VGKARFRRLISAPIAIAVLAVGLLAAAPAARAETWVSYPTLLQEVRGGDLVRAIINPARRDIEIKFRNLSEWHAYFPASAQRELQHVLDARHVRVLFVPRNRAALARHTAVHHHLRYIAAAVLAACLLVSGAILLLRRRGARRAFRPD